MGYKFRLDYINAIQLDDRFTLARYLQEQEAEFVLKLEQKMPNSESLIPQAESIADHCSKWTEKINLNFDWVEVGESEDCRIYEKNMLLFIHRFFQVGEDHICFRHKKQASNQIDWSIIDASR